MARVRFSSVLVALALFGCGGGSGSEALVPPEVDGSVEDTSGGGGDSGGLSVDGGFDGGSACVPRTCAEAGANCGPVSDGCGGLTADCGTCAAGQVCGGGGTPSVCGTTVGDGGGCVARTCADYPGVNCGVQADGCGGLTASCGTCMAPESCGGGGVANKCGVTFVPADGGKLDGGKCVPKTCADYPGANCGYVADGCGEVVSCGTCASGQICGLTSANVCGSLPDGGGCVPKKCSDYPSVECGPQSDSCGGLTANCGTCASPTICGGGGVANKCGNSFADGGVACTPKTCADYPTVNCGQMPDGCGGLTTNCGTCASPYICGGGGVANKCGNSYADDAGVVCKPKTCADQGIECGSAGDGCGGIISSCGVCTAPDICGGGGVPSKCGGGSADGGVVPGCTDPLCAKIPICTTGTTTISGTVRAPNGIEPLYNATVYIPKTGTLAVYGETITCDRCDAPKPALVSAVTGPNGQFTLTGAIPAGTNIPLVIELGRWRRVVNLTVTACAANTLTAAQTRLPRWQAEGSTYDNIPRMAMVTGNVDALECVLKKVGIDNRAFGDPTTTDNSKRIQFYRDNGASYSTSTPAWTTLADNITTMRRYDAILYACRGTESYKTDAREALLRQYANEGGRVFATHFSYVWLRGDSEWVNSAVWGAGGAATSGDLDPLRANVNTGFPKGAAFAQWLGIVGALSVTTPPQVDILYSRKSATNTAGASTKWISSPATPDVQTVQHMTFNTPFTATDPKNYCGRVLFSDFHVNNGSTGSSTFPTHCPNTYTLTDQEKILEFMLFDLASCVNGDNLPPPVPPTCTPKTCAELGAKCGQVANGCGGLTPVCGTCPAGETCGGGGTPGECGGPMCTPKTCAEQGIKCGPASNGCGGTITSCGTCVAPETCGGGGVAGECGGPKCTKTTCTATMTTCGYIPDGCGSSEYCGNCPPGSYCTGGKCEAPKCTKKTCADYGATCGWIGDGCGDKTYCGDCTVAGETCGGGGTPGKCGKPSTTPCTPKTCADLALKCGPAGDGCGGMLDCGKCVAPETCGGGGVPGECGKPSCTPKTCTELGYECGLAADGCGGTMNCGVCTRAGDTCGGGGTAHKCGGGPR